MIAVKYLFLKFQKLQTSVNESYMPDYIKQSVCKLPVYFNVEKRLHHFGVKWMSQTQALGLNGPSDSTTNFTINISISLFLATSAQK